MRLVFLERATADADIAAAVHSDDEHIHVVEAAASVILHLLHFLVCKHFDVRPAVVNIAGRAPQVSARFLYPLTGIIDSP